MKIRSYSELRRLATLKERFDYLSMRKGIGIETFGFDRWINQEFYQSKEWKTFRRDIIARDNGNEMGLDGYPIKGLIVVHHMNPLTEEDIVNSTDALFNPENVICVSDRTHRAIHYGDFGLLPQPLIERKPNDTIPWR